MSRLALSVPNSGPVESAHEDRIASMPTTVNQMWSSVSDEALLAGMAGGDEQAGRVFVERHQRRVYGIALVITHDRATAADVAQEAFLRAWRHASVFDGRRADATRWLSTITRRLAIDALRLRRAVPVEPDDAVWNSAPVGESVEDAGVRAHELARVRRALEHLPPDQRRALVLSAFYGRSAAEIADEEAIPIGTAKSRIRLGLAKVRDALQGEEG
jgi:RNA polymerase sigma-70 factor (ECF subfamily)